MGVVISVATSLAGQVSHRNRYCCWIGLNYKRGFPPPSPPPCQSIRLNDGSYSLKFYIVMASNSNREWRREWFIKRPTATLIEDCIAYITPTLRDDKERRNAGAGSSYKTIKSFSIMAVMAAAHFFISLMRSTFNLPAAAAAARKGYFRSRVIVKCNLDGSSLRAV